MSATRRNVAYFRADRGNLAIWIPVCRHTFVSCFPDIYVPRTDDIWSSVVLIPTLSGNLHNRSPQQQQPKKSSAASIPSLASTSRVVSSRRTRFVCLVVRLFVPLVGCCVVSLPLVVASRPVSSPRHVVLLRLVSRRSSRRRRRVVASSRRCVSSRLVDVTHLVSPALFDCCVVMLHLVVTSRSHHCRRRAPAAAAAVPCRAVLLPPPPLCS